MNQFAPENKEWTVEENLEVALKLKNQGNKYFGLKEYKQALKCYHKALLHLAGLIEKSDYMSAYFQKKAITSECQQIKELKFSVFMNMSQIYIHQGKYSKGIQILEKAIQIKQTSKLMYRKGVCEMKNLNLEKAKQSFIKCCDLDPEIKSEVEKLLQEILELERKEDQKSKQMFKNFFK